MFIVKFDLRLAINSISDVVMNRPAPLREFDQIYMKVADMVVQAEYVARVFDGKKVIFVGDGDGIALSAAHLKAQRLSTMARPLSHYSTLTSVSSTRSCVLAKSWLLTST